MKKLRLELDELSVESFQTDELKGEKGTVEGYNSANCTNTASADELVTCYHSCRGSCPCDPVYPSDDCTGPIDSSVYTGCGNCQMSVNEVGTCIAPC